MKKTRILKYFALLLLLTAFVVPTATFADGMIISPPQYPVYESEQRAVIQYDATSQTETLIVTMRFQGTADDFAWILPVPSTPTVTKGSAEVFTSLENLIYNSSRSSKGALDYATGGVANAPESVSIINREKIDYYDITTLSSTDSSALTTWLNENGYTFPSTSSYILNTYITNKWRFVAVKFDLSAVAKAESDLRSGYAVPLKLVFHTPNPVFPLRISSVMSPSTALIPVPLEETNAATTTNTSDNNTSTAADQPPTNSSGTSEIYPIQPPSSISINLYILADHKKEIPGFSTSYASWVKKSDVESWAVDDVGNPLLTTSQKKLYLTKLTRSMTTSEMQSDLFPRNAKNNHPVGVSGISSINLQVLLSMAIIFSMSCIIITVFGVFSPFGILFILFTIVQIKTRSAAWRVVAWIVQIFCTLVHFAFGVVVALFVIQSGDFFTALSFGTLANVSSRPSAVIIAIPFLLVLGVIAAAPIVVLALQTRWRGCCQKPKGPPNVM
ncbi:MAG: DUF2330 domain-containing protein [bacterium]